MQINLYEISYDKEVMVDINLKTNQIWSKYFGNHKEITIQSVVIC